MRHRRLKRPFARGAILVFLAVLYPQTRSRTDGASRSFAAAVWREQFARNSGRRSGSPTTFRIQCSLKQPLQSFGRCKILRTSARLPLTRRLFAPWAWKETLDADDATARTLGSGQYQKLLFACVGLGLYSFASPFLLLPVFTDTKIALDPGLPDFTQEALSLASSFLFVGWAIASLVVGPIVDRIGRKPIVLAGMMGLLVGTIATVVAPSLPGGVLLYTLARFVVGLFIPTGQAACILIQESIPGELRGRSQAALNVAYSVGVVAMASTCGYVTIGLDWRLEMLLWCIPTFLGLIGVFLFVGESVTYLAASGQRDEAALTLQRIARVNGVEERAIDVVVEVQGSGVVSGSPKVGQDIFGFDAIPQALRPRLGLVAICFVACSMTFYGLNFCAGQLGGSVYANSICLAIVDIVGYSLSASADKLGRRVTQAGSLFLASMFLTLCGFLQTGTWQLLACALSGHFFVDIAFSTVYLFAVELFPTGCRSVALGVCSSSARCVTFFAPLTAGLLAGPKSCIVFGVLCLGGAASTLLLPETMGKKLDGIQD